MKNSKLLVLVITLLLVLNVGQFAVYYWQKYSTRLDLSQRNKNWKTIISERANISFEYPADWPISFISDEELQKDNNFNSAAPEDYLRKTDIESIDFNEEWYRTAGGDRYGALLVWKHPGIETLDDYVKSVDKEGELFTKGKNIPIPRPKMKYSVVGGEVAVTEIAQEGFATPWSISESTNYVLVHNGLIYRIYASGSNRFRESTEENLAKYNRIISTIKFLD